jgi:hypothetical protein
MIYSGTPSAGGAMLDCPDTAYRQPRLRVLECQQTNQVHSWTEFWHGRGST